MCYPKPGPRCSAHAKARYIALKQELSARRAKKYLSWEEESVLQKEIDSAELDFDSTPVGQARLEMRLLQEKYSGDEIRERLANARELRRLQLEAVKARDEGDIHNHGDNGVHFKGEQLQKARKNRKNLRNSAAGRKKVQEYIDYSQNFAQHLTTEEANALYWHTSDGSGVVNQILHKKHDEKYGNSGAWTYEKGAHSWGNMDRYSKEVIQKQVKMLDGVFAKHSLPEPIVLHRGFGMNNLPDELRNSDADSPEMKKYLEEKYPVGETIEIPNYMSASIDPSVAYRFSGFQSMVLEVKTKQAVPVAMMSAWDASEREFVVNRNGKYRVVGVLKNVTYEDVHNKSKTVGPHNKNVTVIQLEEI